MGLVRLLKSLAPEAGLRPSLGEGRTGRGQLEAQGGTRRETGSRLLEKPRLSRGWKAGQGVGRGGGAGNREQGEDTWAWVGAGDEQVAPFPGWRPGGRRQPWEGLSAPVKAVSVRSWREEQGLWEAQRWPGAGLWKVLCGGGPAVVQQLRTTSQTSLKSGCSFHPEPWWTGTWRCREALHTLLRLAGGRTGTPETQGELGGGEIVELGVVLPGGGSGEEVHSWQGAEVGQVGVAAGGSGVPPAEDDLCAGGWSLPSV